MEPAEEISTSNDEAMDVSQDSVGTSTDASIDPQLTHSEAEGEPQNKKKRSSDRISAGDRSPSASMSDDSEITDELNLEGVTTHDASQLQTEVLATMLGDSGEGPMSVDLFGGSKAYNEAMDAVGVETDDDETSTSTEVSDDDEDFVAEDATSGSSSDGDLFLDDTTSKYAEPKESTTKAKRKHLRKQKQDDDGSKSKSTRDEGNDANFSERFGRVNEQVAEEAKSKSPSDDDLLIDDTEMKYAKPKASTIKTKTKRLKKRKEVTGSKFRSTCDDSNDANFIERLSQLDEPPPQELVYKQLGEKLKVSRSVWDRLFKYQKEGVVWLTGLHEEYVGGILADEMGLGKTVQVIAFLRAIDESQIADNYMNFKGLGPSLIMCPSTLLRQWLQEFHTWMPRCRVAILHSIGNYKGSKHALIKKMNVNRRGGSVLITTYSTFLKYQEHILPCAWHYVILDEGHKIRNPTAQITKAVKKFHTPCRLILSGTPLQNSLTEIWSLMDFVYSGRLNTLDTFNERFAIPITQGGYANATKQQLLTAYKCAVVLRDTISPFILRRMKNHVQKTLVLPDKNEKVLFCEITEDQRHLYREYLASRECADIFRGRGDAFAGLITLRKLCNHPDLVNGGPNRHHEYDEKEDKTKAYGYYRRSGKMRVLAKLLKMWNKQAGEKVLIFSQSREMLDIVEQKLQNDKYTYIRMDGSTSIARRMNLVQQFNQDPSVFVFLLSTRVGGLGINLTAANKVVIFDPDWNPSTDTQAKERAYRIGQERAVTIYRLMLAGTIEEKIYHRQIFKEFLANRILKNPKQRQFFKTNDLHDLFSLSEVSKSCPTETGALFAGETDEIRKENFFDSRDREEDRIKKSSKRKHLTKKEEPDGENAQVVELSEYKKAELRARARLMARKLSHLQKDGLTKSVSMDSKSPGNDVSGDVSGTATPAEEVIPQISSDQATTSSREHPTESCDIAKPDQHQEERMGRFEHEKEGCSTESQNISVSGKVSTVHKEDGEILYDIPGTSDQKREPVISQIKKEEDMAEVADSYHHRKKSKKKKRKLWREERFKSVRKDPLSESRINPSKSLSMNSTVEKEDDSYVLGCLLKSAGVRCALDHDDLVGEKSSDYLTSYEADAVATRAAKSIRRRTNVSFVNKFRSKFQNPLAKEHSSLGLKEKKHFQGETSGDNLLAAIHSRKQASNDPGTSSAIQVKDKNVALTQRIRDYLVKCGGKAFSDVVCRKFKKEAKEDWIQFRAILSELCHYDRLKMEWHLKNDYW
uniref:DNA repair and recombination protein RAD54-like n=1 Tax=Haemonchus contortus TaxID=6289 RepID=A0A7I4XVA1_HAECO